MNTPGVHWLALVATMLPASTAAQTIEPVSVQGLGVYVVRRPQGHDVVENDARLGWEAQIRYTFSSLSVGVGYQRSTVHMGFIEPRFVPTAWGAAAVYFAGRGGLASLVCDPGVTCAEQRREIVLGGGGGFLYRLGARLTVDAGVQYFTTYFTPSQGGATKQRTGWVQARLGLNLGLRWGDRGFDTMSPCNPCLSSPLR